MGSPAGCPRLGCQSAMVGTGWTNSCLGCMNRLRKRYSDLVGGSSLAGKGLGSEWVFDNQEC